MPHLPDSPSAKQGSTEPPHANSSHDNPNAHRRPCAAPTRDEMLAMEGSGWDGDLDQLRGSAPQDPTPRPPS